MDVSVLICCYNRKTQLEQALKSLENIKVDPELDWEIIVVDNNSSDGTAAFVSEIISRTKLKLKYLFEGRQGKSYALNTGIAASQGEVLAFTDDDCLFPENWIQKIGDVFKLDPKLACLGGRVELYNELDAPITIRVGRENKMLNLKNFDPSNIAILGCNMIIRKSILNGIGNFDIRFGPGSAKQAVVEDVDILYRICKKGLKVTYHPDIMLYHNHGRKAEDTTDSLNKNYLKGRGAFYGKYILRGDITVLKWAYYETTNLVRLIFSKIKTKQNWQSEKIALTYLAQGVWELLMSTLTLKFR